MWELCCLSNKRCTYFTLHLWSSIFNHQPCQDVTPDQSSSGILTPLLFRETCSEGIHSTFPNQGTVSSYSLLSCAHGAWHHVKLPCFVLFTTELLLKHSYNISLTIFCLFWWYCGLNSGSLAC
jgi:hypothetical protein